MNYLLVIYGAFETLLFLVLCLIFLRFCCIISTHCNVGIDDNLGRECLSSEWVGMKKNDAYKLF